MQKYISLVLITVFLLSACNTVTAPVTKTVVKSEGGLEKSTSNKEDMQESESQKKLEAKSDSGKDAMQNSDVYEAQYVTYSEDIYKSLLGQKPFALFFHAGWCPICQRMEKDILEGLNEFPEGTVILKADYDKETQLKQKYLVQTQSTILFFDAEGKQTGKLLGPQNEAIIEEIKKSQK